MKNTQNLESELSFIAKHIFGSSQATLRFVRMSIMSQFAILWNIFLSFVKPVVSASFPKWYKACYEFHVGPTLLVE